MHAQVKQFIEAVKKNASKVWSDPEDEDGNVDAQLLINGIEVPFDEIMVRFEKEYHRYVNRQARFILVQRAQRMMNILDSMER